MNITCSICMCGFGDAEVSTTTCGHVFHRRCIIQWLQSSNTCPQCRRTLRERNLSKLYFNFVDNNSGNSDNGVQLVLIDKLNNKIKSLEQSVKESNEKKEMLNRQKTQLTRQIGNLKVELDEKQRLIDNVNEQIQSLQGKMKHFQKIERLLNDPIDEVSDIISQVRDPEALHIYIVVMKRELMASVDRQRELRSKVKDLQVRLNKVSDRSISLAEEHEKRKQLEAELMMSEKTRLILQYRIEQLTANASINTPSSADVRPNVTKVSNITRLTENARDQNENTENSPYLPVKSQGVFAAGEYSQKRCQTSELGFSIFARKKLRVIPPNGNSIATGKSTYDGYGGHAKYDRFPSPISGVKLKRSVDESKRENKKAKLDTNDN